MPEIDISVSNLSKSYRIPTAPVDGSGSFLRKFFSHKEEIWAVKDINFEVSRGEALGIVGHNGAGKSTIIKILSGITVPTRGHLVIRGTLSALVEVGAGFNVELTGRENVFLAGAILGMGRREIARKITDILEFSGIGNYIDAPVKTYSSGQFLRLGFSIAAQLEHDIFLLDEVLAVGDVTFQARCFERVGQLRRAGKTLVLISHDLVAIESICDRAILLNRGAIVMVGKPREIIEEYSRTAYSAMTWATTASSVAKLVNVYFKGPEREPVQTGKEMTAHVSILLSGRITDPIIVISFYWPSGYLCTQLTSASCGHDRTLRNCLVNFDFSCPALTMQRGLYRVDVAIKSGRETIAEWHRCSLLRVVPGMIVLGDFYVEHSCRMSVQHSSAAPPVQNLVSENRSLNRF
jgi:ABC-type polysaccharide/polyol phosphate transport system ATPase subunit